MSATVLCESMNQAASQTLMLNNVVGTTFINNYISGNQRPRGLSLTRNGYADFLSLRLLFKGRDIFKINDALL